MKQPKIKRHTLGDCPNWFQEHSDWSPWETGRTKVLNEICKWYATYASQTYDGYTPAKLAEDAPFVSRMLTCLIFHWERKGVERPHTEIVDALEQGKGSDGGDLKGKPFFDLVLTDAMCNGQKKAGEYYGQKVEPQILSSAKYAHGLFGVPSDDDWRGDFYCYLIETNTKLQDKPLERYLGISGLVPWLRKLLIGFLRDRFRKEGRYRTKVDTEGNLSDDPSGPSLLENYCDENGTPLDFAVINELAELVQSCLVESLEDLTPKERLRLGFFYGNSHQNRLIARFFKEKDYQTTRERQKVENRFLETFSKLLDSKILSHPAIAEAQPQLIGVVAQVLVDLLKTETKEYNHEFEQ